MLMLLAAIAQRGAKHAIPFETPAERLDGLNVEDRAKDPAIRRLQVARFAGMQDGEVELA